MRWQYGKNGCNSFDAALKEADFLLRSTSFLQRIPLFFLEFTVSFAMLSTGKGTGRFTMIVAPYYYFLA
jgi:hypothetical protein